MVFEAGERGGFEGYVSVEAPFDCELVGAVRKGTICESRLYIFILRRFRVMPFFL